MKKIYSKIFLTTLVIGFIICFGYYYSKDYKTMETVQSHLNGEVVTFSLDSGFYDKSLSVSLTKNIEIPSSARIFYTLDGDDPTSDDFEYTSPIELKKKNVITVYPLKVTVYYNGEYSDIFEKTYVLGGDSTNKFDLDFISITSDSSNLYDYETGILVKGKTYDENLKNYDGTGIVPGNYSNRGEKWIRNAHITLLDSKGIVEIDQNVGIEVAGGSSSGYSVKSLKIYADRDYDKENDKLRICFEDEDSEYSLCSHVDEYNSIRLRSGSQDMEFGNIRSSVISRLARLSGFDGCTATKRCVVYLNGSFYGIFDMQQNYTASFLTRRFNLDNSEYIEKEKGSETDVLKATGISKYFNTDLNDINNRKILEQHVDMDNYLLYYAINILCNNTDWPGNNFEMWRYTGEYDNSNQYSDGRYRFLIFDTDMTFGTDLSLEFFDGSKADTFVSLMEGNYRALGTSFSKVMGSTYYRDRFITIITDLLNTSFSNEQIDEIIREENEKIASVREEYYDKEYVNRAVLNVEQIREAAEKRSTEIENSFAYYFGVNEKYELSLRTSEGINVSWNNMSLFADDIYCNQYYKGVNLVLNQDAYPGYTFQYWIVNGKKIYDNYLEVTEDMIQNGTIAIEAVSKINDSSEVIISELSARGYSDWIRISNVGSISVNLKEYYISDDEKNMLKYQLPNVVLEPGDSIVIDGSKNYDSIGDYVCNFSLNEDETIFLSDDISCLFSLYIPKMSEIESYGRYDYSNVWTYNINKSDFRKKDYE